MPAYTAVTKGLVLLGDSETVVIRLRVPDPGKYVVFGRLVAVNMVLPLSGGVEATNASVRLTTFDGETELDKVDIRVFNDSFGSVNVSVCLQGTLILPGIVANGIVDIRCIIANGAVQEVSLFAILVDDLVDGIA